MGDLTLVEVSKEEFFAFVNPRDIIGQSLADHTVWKTRRHQLVGKSYPGYLCKGEKKWMLTSEAKAALSKESVT